MHKWLGLVVALAACAGAGAGKGAAPGENHASISSTTTATGGSALPPTEAATAKLPPYPAAPADPWRGVVGDQPRRWTEDRARHWLLRSDEFDCSAAHDHCIDPDAWFFVRDAERDRGGPVPAAWDVFGSDAKPASASNVRRPAVGEDGGWQALRTVPATRTNLVRGAGVITLERGAAKPTSGVASHDAAWIYGVVDEVDLGQASFTIANGSGAFPLWGARVVVLSWAPGTKVQIVGGKQRSELGVKVSETFSTP